MTGRSTPLDDPDEDMFPGADNGDIESDTPTADSAMTTHAGSPKGSAGANASATAKRQQLVHHASGYTWEKDEDRPGYSWKNKKSREEAVKAWDMLLDKDKRIGRTYGDIGLRK